MKYLVSGDQVTPAASHKDQINFLECAKEWVEKSKADGKLDAAYSFPDGGGMFVLDAKDHEELMRLLLNFPLRPFSNLEIRPLLDFNTSANITIEALKPFV
ncbi:muconolactone Delta-isomerase family protein [Dehalogenimonas sp. THU2]|uniref:muconolactone Delta-isomerase family protein n=1 Tax=Dehalogenimonas sp. THU2 TaxID=3151121 RepID=UPI003218999D